LQCCVCGLEHFDKNAFSKGEWIKCQKPKTWLNKVCIGPQCRKGLSVENVSKFMKEGATEIA
jgi:hypothetical protein